MHFLRRLINGILLPKLFWSTVRKNCSSDREKLLKFEAEGQEVAKILKWQDHVLCMFCPCSALVVFMYWTGNSMNNLLSYCGLIDAKIRASHKDLPVSVYIPNICLDWLFNCLIVLDLIGTWPNWNNFKKFSVSKIVLNCHCWNKFSFSQSKPEQLL